MVCVMGPRANQRTLEGKLRYCPVPGESLALSSKFRWMHVRDGLKLVIEALPFEERVVGARLQEHWAYACRKVEDFEEQEEPPWVLPY